MECENTRRQPLLHQHRAPIHRFKESKLMKRHATLMSRLALTVVIVRRHACLPEQIRLAIQQQAINKHPFYRESFFTNNRNFLAVSNT